LVHGRNSTCVAPTTFRRIVAVIAAVLVHADIGTSFRFEGQRLAEGNLATSPITICLPTSIVKFAGA